jgi:hypothetical protein
VWDQPARHEQVQPAVIVEINSANTGFAGVILGNHRCIDTEMALAIIDKKSVLVALVPDGLS